MSGDNLPTEVETEDGLLLIDTETQESVMLDEERGRRANANA